LTSLLHAEAKAVLLYDCGMLAHMHADMVQKGGCHSQINPRPEKVSHRLHVQMTFCLLPKSCWGYKELLLKMDRAGSQRTDSCHISLHSCRAARAAAAAAAGAASRGMGAAEPAAGKHRHKAGRRR
jgi:hypothetical protein